MVADTQTKGRGRAEKVWESPRGGLWFSVILRPSIKAGMAGVLQILAATAVRRALKRERVRVGLKWPNDIVLGSRKLGGILVETKTVADRLLFSIVGIGINANQPQAMLPDGAVSLYTSTGRKANLRRLLGLIVDELRVGYAGLQEPSRLVAEWWRYCVHAEKKVRVDSPQGVLIGLSKGISPEGLLLVETQPGHVVRVSEGTLTVLD